MLPLTPLEEDAQLSRISDAALAWAREPSLTHSERVRGIRQYVNSAFFAGSKWGREHHLRWGTALGVTASVVAYTVAQIVVAVLR